MDDLAEALREIRGAQTMLMQANIFRTAAPFWWNHEFLCVDLFCYCSVCARKIPSCVFQAPRECFWVPRERFLCFCTRFYVPLFFDRCIERFAYYCFVRWSGCATLLGRVNDPDELADLPKRNLETSEYIQTNKNRSAHKNL